MSGFRLVAALAIVWWAPTIALHLTVRATVRARFGAELALVDLLFTLRRNRAARRVLAASIRRNRRALRVAKRRARGRVR